MKNEEQKQIAKMLEEELKWNATLENSKEQLTKLALDALKENKRYQTQKNDW